MRSEILTIPALIQRRRESDGERLAVIADDRAIMYADLDRASAVVAARLVRAGVSKGNRIGLLMENGVDWVVLALAVMRVGGVLVPLSTFLQLGELREQLNAASVQQLIVTAEFNGRDYAADLATLAPPWRATTPDQPLEEPALPSLRRIWPAQMLLDHAEQTGRAHTGVVSALEDCVTPTDDMAIMFTSGSSGSPKGCIHTHGSALTGVMTSLGDRGVGPEDRLYLPMPLFWTGGFGMGLLTALITGCTLVTESTSEPGRTLRLIAKHGITLFRGWPDQASRIAEHPDFAGTDRSTLRLGSLDALMPRELRAAAPEARASLLGMTETFGPYCCYPLSQDMPQGKWGSSGKVQPAVDVRIVDATTREPVPPGQSGKILIKGPNMMRGVCGRENAALFDADGYYDTGDLGRVDADGFMFYEGRADDMFKAKGATVYPGEVERALQDVPGVSRAFVTDVEAAGTDREVGAAVVRAPGHDLDAGLLAAELKGRLSAFKRPTRWLIVATLDDIPMLSSGKVDRRALRAELARAGR